MPLFADFSDRLFLLIMLFGLWVMLRGAARGHLRHRQGNRREHPGGHFQEALNTDGGLGAGRPFFIAVDAEDLVITVRTVAAVWGFALVLGIVFAELGVNRNVAPAVAVVVAVVVCVVRVQQQLSSEAAQQRWRAIAACAQATLDDLDQPLAEEHYRAAFRRLCRAIADGRRRVRLLAGDRTVEITLKKI